MKDVNSSEVNWGPLSLTTCSGIPNWANRSRSFVIVFVVVVVDISNTSGHLECESTMTRNDVPMNGPAKSIQMRCQGFSGQVHGCKVAGVGAFLFCWHDVHVLVMISVQLLQDVRLKFAWHYDSNSP